MKPRVEVERLSTEALRVYLNGFGKDLSILYYSDGEIYRMGNGYYLWDLSLKSFVNLFNTRNYYRIGREFLLTTYYFLFKKSIMKEVDKILVKEML